MITDRPDEVTAAIKLEPRIVKRCGEQRRRPDGGLLTENYDENHWSVDLDQKTLTLGVDLFASSHKLDVMRQIAVGSSQAWNDVIALRIWPEPLITWKKSDAPPFPVAVVDAGWSSLWFPAGG